MTLGSLASYRQHVSSPIKYGSKASSRYTIPVSYNDDEDSMILIREVIKRPNKRDQTP